MVNIKTPLAYHVSKKGRIRAVRIMEGGDFGVTTLQGELLSRKKVVDTVGEAVAMARDRLGKIARRAEKMLARVDAGNIELDTFAKKHGGSNV